MTFWHSLVSFKAHLAHLPSPVIVMRSSAANVFTVTAANNNAATPATNANDLFIVRSFWLCLLLSAPADIKSTNLNWLCSNEFLGKSPPRTYFSQVLTGIWPFRPPSDHPSASRFVAWISQARHPLSSGCSGASSARRSLYSGRIRRSDEAPLQRDEIVASEISANIAAGFPCRMSRPRS